MKENNQQKKWEKLWDLKCEKMNLTVNLDVIKMRRIRIRTFGFIHMLQLKILKTN